MAGHIMLRRDNAAVQPFIEQDIRRFRQRLPGRECPRNLIPRNGFIIGVQIFARLAFAVWPYSMKVCSSSRSR
jgi:hypothetical protein